MGAYVIDLTMPQANALAMHGPEAVTTYLASREPPYAVDAVSIRIRPTPAIVIDADRDPSGELTGWNPPPSRDDLARAVVVQTVQAVLAKEPATRTPMERWVLAVSWLTLRVGEED